VDTSGAPYLRVGAIEAGTLRAAMTRLARDRTMAAGLALFSFALAFWQRPGWATSDTKIDLHVDPVSFLGQSASVWTHSIDLGAVHGVQYSGYLWPMGPFFALLHSIGLSAWVAHRVWLALLLALSGWGVLKLCDVLVGRPRGPAHLVAAVFYVVNPYTAMFTGRTSVVFLGYAALPWLLLVTFHGVRAARAAGRLERWAWPAAFALILTSIGGGINGAVIGWMLPGPLVLMIYEPLIGSVRWRDSAAFLVRLGVLGTLASLWWIVPLLVHSRYGFDFLQFTEQPRAIWGTNASTEALRLMAYWTSYIGVGFYGASRPLFSESGTLLFNPAVVGASLLIPALAVAGYVATRRRRYAPFFLLVLIVGMVIETAGFPVGTPIRDGMEWVYRNVEVLRFMRTTQKAAPLVAIGTAGLLGLAAQLAWVRLRALPPGRLRAVALVAAPAAAAALIALAALPLTRGTAVERQIAWKQIPSAWSDAGRDLDRDLPRNSRALVLPGQIFANYSWGGTIDAILPRLTDRPVAARYETPYGDPRATDLLWTVDRLVQQRRLVPGQLTPLLQLMGVGAVVTGSDDDISRSGAVNAAAAAEELDGQGLARPSRSYGPARRVTPPAGEIAPPRALPQVRRYDIPPGRGLVHVAPSGPPTIVDGGAEGLAAMTAFGALPERRRILYAGDLSARQLRAHAARGAEVVVTDSNRRRRVIPEFGHQNLGPTLPQTESVGANFAFIEPFTALGSPAQTVAALKGAKYVRAPSEGGLLEFPEYGAIAAFDGDLSTVWAADRYFQPSDRWIEVGFHRPRDVPYVDLYPVRDWRGVEREVDVNGTRARLGPGRNRVRLGLEDVTSLRVTLTRVDQPMDTELRGSGGFREIRVPGVRLRQSLRPPVITARALAGRDLSRVDLSYVFERTTADGTFQRDRQTGSPLIELARNRADPERQIDRLVFAPAARSYSVDAWAHPAVDAPDSALDRMAGVNADAAFESSGRFHNQPRYRASSAFDATPRTAWIGIWARPSSAYPWISFTSARPLSVSRLRLVAPRPPVRRPTSVRLSWPGGDSGPLEVAADGTVELPRAARSRRFRLTVLDSRLARRPGERRRATRAVGIASLEVPGLRPVEVPRAGPVRAACGSLEARVGSELVRLRPRGTIADLDAGRPLRARACDGRARLAAGIRYVRSLPGTFSTDLLRLRSPAPVPLPPPVGGGEVVDPGRVGNSSVSDVRVELDGPSWLILGQSFSKGWEATCDGRSLGEPQPMNGYANGWPAPADCSRVSFDFKPQRTALAAYVVSGVVAVLLVVLLLASGVLRRRRDPEATYAPDPLPPERTRPMSLPRAAAIALAATIPLSLVFALRTSVLIFPGLTLILWQGVGSRLITAAAALLLLFAVPAAYLISSPEDSGGFNFEYSIEIINAHWVGVAALILLMVACGRTLASARSRAGPSTRTRAAGSRTPNQ
jgi:hypothetical protein